jgi:hypothetical protein
MYQAIIIYYYHLFEQNINLHLLNKMPQSSTVTSKKKGSMSLTIWMKDFMNNLIGTRIHWTIKNKTRYIE